jgi:uncharacterized delta-60 repeat protein
VNGSPQNSIVRLNADGSIDASFKAGTGANGPVSKVVIQGDDKLVVAGDFTEFNGKTARSLIRLNADGSIDSGFDVSAGPNGIVTDADIQADGKIVIAGSFNSVQNTLSDGLARLNADGKLDANLKAGAATGGSAGIAKIKVRADGKIIIAGDFSAISGIPRVKIAQLNADGSLDASFDAKLGTDSKVLSLETDTGGKLLVGGKLTLPGSTNPSGLVRLNADGSVDSNVNVDITNSGAVAAIQLLADGKVIIGGDTNLGRLLSILAAEAPHILNILIKNRDSVELSISTQAGRNYVLETNADITANNWAQILTLLGDGSVKTFTHASASGNVRFYRIRTQ